MVQIMVFVVVMVELEVQVVVVLQLEEVHQVEQEILLLRLFLKEIIEAQEHNTNQHSLEPVAVEV